MRALSSLLTDVKATSDCCSFSVLRLSFCPSLGGFAWGRRGIRRRRVGGGGWAEGAARRGEARRGEARVEDAGEERRGVGAAP
jgi:hypothetical protein